MNMQQSAYVPVRQTRSTTRLRHCEARRKLLELLRSDPNQFLDLGRLMGVPHGTLEHSVDGIFYLNYIPA